MKKLLPFLFILLCGALHSSAQCTATLTPYSTNVCSGDSAVLYATPSGQVNYEWFVNGVSVGNMGSDYQSQNLAPGSYTFEVEITDVNSCVAISAPVTITIDQTPTVSLSNNGPLCVGSTLQLSSTISNATAFTWWGPNSWTSSLQNPTITNIQQNQGGTYYVTATNGVCDITTPTYVTVNGTTPTVTATADSVAVCTGSWAMLSAQTTNLSGISYSWTGPNGFSSTLPYPYLNNVTPADAGIYTLTVTGTGCAGIVTISDTALLVVVNSPTVTATAGPNPCVGGTIQLNGSVTGGTYHWIGPNAFTSTQLNPSIINAQLTDAGIYQLLANNNGCTSSASVSVSVLSNTPSALASTAGMLCTADSFMGSSGATINVITSGMTGVSYSWSGPNGFTSTSAYNDLSNGTSADAGTYTVTVAGMGCAGLTTITSQVFVSGAACDSVWPGDADNNYEVNNWDMMKIGLAYGATGPARSGASNNWVAQYATDWNTTFNNFNLNHKYADCNGDGIVNGLDSVAIILNYGQWHNKGEHVAQAKTTGFPDLYFDVSGVMLTPGAIVNIPIKLGTNAVAMQDVYGIAASIKVQGVSPTVPMYITAGGWLGDNTNSMSVAKSVSNAQTDWTLVRTNHSNVSGDGTIAVLTFTVPLGSDNQTALFYFDNVLMVNNNGEEIADYNVVDDNSIVYPVKINTATAPASNVLIVPNPSDAQANLLFSLSTDTKLNIVITDVTGRMVWSKQQQYGAGLQNISLPGSEVAAGLYNIQLRDDKGTMIQNLKWVKK